VEENPTTYVETNYEYDYEIAITRNDIAKKDTSASSDYRMHHRGHHEERDKVGADRDRAVVNREVHVTAAWENHGTGWTRTNLV
jgi:hypothetical protein